MLKRLLLLFSLLLVFTSCYKEDISQLCVYPVGEFAESVYLYKDGRVYGEAAIGYCIEEGMISFYAEPIEGYTFVKWCGFSDVLNSPMTSRFSNPVVLGGWGPSPDLEVELEAVYKVKGTADPLGACGSAYYTGVN